MSHHLTNLTWGIELRGMQKLVLLALAHLSVQSTCECTPTVRRLAFMCGVSTSCVRSQLDALKAKGFVDELQADGTTLYRVNVAPREKV